MVGAGFGELRSQRNRRAARRGQTLLEFALILPIFLLLLFSIIEFALINVSIGSFNFAAQDAARYGAIVGPTDPNSDTTMLTTIIEPRINQIVAAQLVSIEVFKATEDGACFGGPATFPCSSEDSYNAQTQTWTYGWPATIRNDQLIIGDYLGVRITYTYTYVTAFFATLSPSITFTAESVQRIEPQEFTHRHVRPAIASVLSAAGLARLWESSSLVALRSGQSLSHWITNHVIDHKVAAVPRAIAGAYALMPGGQNVGHHRA